MCLGLCVCVKVREGEEDTDDFYTVLAVFPFESLDLGASLSTSVLCVDVLVSRARFVIVCCIGAYGL